MYATCQPLVGSLIPDPLLHSCAGAAGRPISVRYKPATNGQREYRHQDKQAVEDPAVASQLQWGWPPAACVEALARLRGSPGDAHQDLFGRLTGGLLQETSLAILCTTSWWPAAGGILCLFRSCQRMPPRTSWDSWQVGCCKTCRY